MVDHIFDANAAVGFSNILCNTFSLDFLKIALKIPFSLLFITLAILKQNWQSNSQSLAFLNYF